jgi:cation diffusion facilitator CzcD-associated flavoprotein CzcO
MGVNTLLIDKEERVGDAWRNRFVYLTSLSQSLLDAWKDVLTTHVIHRYPNLTLHTPARHSSSTLCLILFILSID